MDRFPLDPTKAITNACVCRLRDEMYSHYTNECPETDLAVVELAIRLLREFHDVAAKAIALSMKD